MATKRESVVKDVNLYNYRERIKSILMPQIQKCINDVGFDFTKEYGLDLFSIARSIKLELHLESIDNEEVLAVVRSILGSIRFSTQTRKESMGWSLDFTLEFQRPSDDY